LYLKYKINKSSFQVAITGSGELRLIPPKKHIQLRCDSNKKEINYDSDTSSKAITPVTNRLYGSRQFSSRFSSSLMSAMEEFVFSAQSNHNLQATTKTPPDPQQPPTPKISFRDKLLDPSQETLIR
jgi:hypothetical protein